MPYIHDPFPRLTSQQYRRYGQHGRTPLGRDPLALPWEGDPLVMQTYGPYVGSGLRAQVPPPYQPTGQAADKTKNTLFMFALLGAVVWFGLRATRSKKRANPCRRSNAKLKYRQRQRMASSKFAMPGLRKLPIQDASHVRNAMARFSQVKGATGAQKARAYHKIMAAAGRYGIRAEGFERKYGGRYRRRA